MLDTPAGSPVPTPVARFENLRVEFQTKDGTVVGVEDVSFDIGPGETVCVVGESGSGKSVSSLSLMRLVEYGGGTIAGGRILFDRGAGAGLVDLAETDLSRMRSIRGNEIGMIFQEPMTSLNPVFTVGKQLTEHLRVHKGLTKAEATEKALDLLRQVRIPEPERRLAQYPHELSGGMRQRVVIAIALACEPRLLIADEPTTALDVTIQAEILALIDRLKRETGAAVLFITHDMAVVAQMADRVVVMYRGRKVEEGPVAEIFENPQHDYTKSLLAAVPKLGEMTGKDAPEPMRLLGSVAKVEGPIEIKESRVLLDVKHLVTRFPVKGGFFRRTVANVHAVEDVSFRIMAGETLSLVGESGCGKSTCGRSILRLVDPLVGAGLARREGRDDLRRRGVAACPARHADGVPGPLRLAQSANAAARPGGGTPAKLQPRLGKRTQRPGGPAVRPGGVAAQLHAALSARACRAGSASGSPSPGRWR
jgi:ABC-type glutathione transport system ATPase component